MDLRHVDQSGIRVLGPDDGLGSPASGFSWVDIPEWSDEAEEYLRSLGCHEMVLDACRSRNHVPTVHAYADHVFITTQSPLLGQAGHVHLLELDQIIGRDFLVTVHGPLNPVVDPQEALVETEAVLRRIQSGPVPSVVPRTSCPSPSPRGWRAVSATMITQVAEKLPGLERHVMDSRLKRPRGAARADVPDPPRADHHPHDGRAVQRRLGPAGRPRAAAATRTRGAT